MRISVVLWFLLLAVVIEIVVEIAVMNKIKRFEQVKKIKNVGFFALLTVGIGIGTLPHEWMWIFLTCMYLIRSIFSFLLPFKQNGSKKEKKTRKWKPMVFAIMITFLSFIPVLIWPGYKRIPETGNFQVATKSYTYEDTGRIETYDDSGEYRKLTVQFWYPEAGQDQKYPLVIFSHGSMGIRSSNESLFYELASHGYVVCSIDHTYQCMSTTDVDGNITRISREFMKDLQNLDVKKDISGAFNSYEEWMKVRTSDINFVLNTILEKGSDQKEDVVYRMIDSNRIGAMGHSLGGSAVLGMGRMRQDIKAVIALEAPFMCDIEGVNGDEFVFTDEPYPVPVLNVYSDSAWDKMKDWDEYKKNVELLGKTDETAYNVYIKNTNHMALTDLSLSCPIMVTLFDVNLHAASNEYVLKTINQFTLDFFDCYLKEEGTFDSYGVFEE